jgi:hypothetical protein
MGNVVKLTDVPQVVRTSTYDADIQQALKMRKDEALKIDVPKGKKATNIGLALGQRIKTLGHADKLHVSRVRDEVYVLHGPMRLRKKLKK